MKILVPVIHWSVSSDAAYRISDIANTYNADILVLFIVSEFSTNSYLRGETAIQIFEEAAQGYDVAVSGCVVAGPPTQAVGKVAIAEQVDLIMLGAKSEEEEDWQVFSNELVSCVNCEIQLLGDDQMLPPPVLF